MLQLQLTRRLILLDLETHAFVGVNDARIVDLCMRVFEPDGSRRTWHSLINPECHIAAEATETHGITDEMVKDAPTFKAFIDDGMAEFFSVPCDWAGYNHRAFDMKVLQGNCERAGFRFSYEDSYLIDAYRLWQVKEGRTLGDAVDRFLKRGQSEAHRAKGDVEDTNDVLVAMLELWPDLPRTPEEIHKLCYLSDPRRIDEDGKFQWREGGACFTFGKWEGKSIQHVAKVDPGYLRWIQGGSFHRTTKKVCMDALNGVFPVKP